MSTKHLLARALRRPGPALSIIQSTEIINLSRFRTFEEFEAFFTARKFWGLQIEITLHGCDPDDVRNGKRIRPCVIELCKRIDMVRHGPCRIDCFGDKEEDGRDLYGHSALQFIKTSSIVLHLDRPDNAAFWSIFTCKICDPNVALAYLFDYWQATEWSMLLLGRRSEPGGDVLGRDDLPAALPKVRLRRS